MPEKHPPGKTVLIIEDDPDIRRILGDYLQREQFSVLHASDGRSGLQQVSMAAPDLILLDINIPHINGFEVIKKVREIKATPIIVVSALSEDGEKLQGLDYGADDYVVKPFNPKEVVARVKAVLRRVDQHDQIGQPVRCGPFELSAERKQVVATTQHGPVELDLTPAEYFVLEAFIRAPTKVFTRSELLENCFPDSDALERTIDSHISHLRRKLKELGLEDYLVSRRGLGYALQKQEAP